MEGTLSLKKSTSETDAYWANRSQPCDKLKLATFTPNLQSKQSVACKFICAIKSVKSKFYSMLASWLTRQRGSGDLRTSVSYAMIPEQRSFKAGARIAFIDSNSESILPLAKGLYCIMPMSSSSNNHVRWVILRK